MREGVAAYLWGNPISLVFQNIDPPSPSPPGECVLPPQQRRRVHTRRAERGMGGGVNILEDERNRIALLQLNMYFVDYTD